MTSTGDTPVFSTKYPLLYQPVHKKNSATTAETTNVAVWQKKVDPDTTPRTAKVVGYFD